MKTLTKVFIGLSVMALALIIGLRLSDLWSCKSSGWFDLHRPTHFSFITGNCVVHSGRINAEDGKPVWVILKNDRGLGDGADDGQEDH